MSPQCPSHSILKNALSLFLRQTITDAGALQGDTACLPRAHSIRVLKAGT